MITHGDLYDYSKVEYVGNTTRVNIICKLHNKEFLQSPKSHKNGSGCPICKKENFTRTKWTTESFIAHCMILHNGSYEYDKTIYTKSSNDVVIKCKEHGYFSQRAKSHLEKKGCIDCGHDRTKQNNTADLNTFIKKAKSIHGELYVYDRVDYQGVDKMVLIQCRTHGYFEQTPMCHYSTKVGCSKCAKCYIPTTDEFIESAKLAHGELYIYDRAEYKASNTKLLIGCKMHGYFEQTPNLHVNNKSGCPSCGHITTGYKQRSNTQLFVENAKATHGDTYIYDRVDYQTNNEYVLIQCKKHGYFQQKPRIHVNAKSGCPKCANRKFSKMQIYWLSFLETMYRIDIQHLGNSVQEYSIKGSRWKADGYCKSTHTIYEFHGDFWHGHPTRYDPEFINVVTKKKMKTLYAKTIARESKIRELGYNLVVLWESEWILFNKFIRRVQRNFKAKRALKMQQA